MMSACFILWMCAALSRVLRDADDMFLSKNGLFVKERIDALNIRILSIDNHKADGLVALGDETEHFLDFSKGKVKLSMMHPDSKKKKDIGTAKSLRMSGEDRKNFGFKISMVDDKKVKIKTQTSKCLVSTSGKLSVGNCEGPNSIFSLDSTDDDNSKSDIENNDVSDAGAGDSVDEKGRKDRKNKNKNSSPFNNESNRVQKKVNDVKKNVEEIQKNINEENSEISKKKDKLDQDLKVAEGEKEKMAAEKEKLAKEKKQLGERKKKLDEDKKELANERARLEKEREQVDNERIRIGKEIKKLNKNEKNKDKENEDKKKDTREGVGPVDAENKKYENKDSAEPGDSVVSVHRTNNEKNNEEKQVIYVFMEGGKEGFKLADGKIEMVDMSRPPAESSDKKPPISGADEKAISTLDKLIIERLNEKPSTKNKKKHGDRTTPENNDFEDRSALSETANDDTIQQAGEPETPKNRPRSRRHKKKKKRHSKQRKKRHSNSQPAGDQSKALAPTVPISFVNSQQPSYQTSPFILNNPNGQPIFQQRPAVPYANPRYPILPIGSENMYLR